MAAPSTPIKVALITGGSSGIGFAVSRALAAQGGWEIHIVDLQPPPHEAGDGGTPPSRFLFHRANVRDYTQLGAAFLAAFQVRRRLDFVFANAGIIEKVPPYVDSNGGDKEDGAGDDRSLPPRLDYAAVEVNLQGAADTAHLARHFMVRSAGENGKVKGKGEEKGAIVVSASCASVWPAYWAPVYTASKFGILGFVRSVAGQFKLMDGIRINALLPGAVRTPIIEWGEFPEDAFTPMELITQVVLLLARGEEIVDSKGARVPVERAYGQAMVVTGKSIYLQPEAEYCDEVMELTIESSKVENRFKGVVRD